MSLFPEDKAFDDVLEQRLKAPTTCEVCNQFNETSWIGDIHNLVYLNEKYNFLNDDDVNMLYEQCENIEMTIRDFNMKHYMLSEHLQKIKLCIENLTEKWDSCSDEFKRQTWCRSLMCSLETFNTASNTLVRSCLLEVINTPEHSCFYGCNRFPTLLTIATNIIGLIQKLRAHTTIPVEEKKKYAHYTRNGLYYRLCMLASKAQRCACVSRRCEDFVDKLNTILVPILFRPYQDIPVRIPDYDEIPHIIDLKDGTPSFADSNRNIFIH